jgi:hypothetical protein
MKKLLNSLAMAFLLGLAGCGGGDAPVAESCATCEAAAPGTPSPAAPAPDAPSTGNPASPAVGGTPTPTPTTDGGTATPDSGTAGPGGGSGTGDSVGDSGSGGSGGSGGTGGTGGSGSAGGGTGDSGTGTGGGSGGVGGDGTGVAGGVGSGGTGVSGDGGVGSGGTGSPAASLALGAVDGFGSIVVNSIHYEVGSATLTLADATQLQLGMTVRIEGRASGLRGTATQVASSLQLRGTVAAVRAEQGEFDVLGTRVSVDSGTVFDGVGALSAIAVGDAVQVYGVPGAPGELRATRIEAAVPPAAPVVSGPVQQLDTVARTLRIGSLTVAWADAAFEAPLTAAQLADGLPVEVRSDAPPVAGVLTARTLKPLRPLPATPVEASLMGLVTDFAGRSSFRVQGIAVNAAGVQVTGGPATSLGNGVKVELEGRLEGGTLRATRLKIRHVPGTGGPVAFSAQGRITQFTPPASFKIQGQAIDAGGASVVYRNGSRSDLANGRRVTVLGSRVEAGVLLADEVRFD